MLPTTMRPGTLPRPCSRFRWPVWLLLAAWLAANSPPAATRNLLEWAGGARHLSHQDRLKGEVAFLLSGHRPAPRVAKSLPARPASPPIAIEAALRKIEFYLSAAVETVRPEARELNLRAGSLQLPESNRAEPPYPPPREERVA